MFREFRLSLVLSLFPSSSPLPPSFFRLSVCLFFSILFFTSPSLSPRFIVVWGKNMELRPAMFVFVDGKRSRVNRTQTRSKVAGKEYAREFCVHCSRWKQTQRKELLLKFVRTYGIELLFLYDERWTDSLTILSPKKKKKKKAKRKEDTNGNRIVENGHSIYRPL